MKGGNLALWSHLLFLALNTPLPPSGIQLEWTREVSSQRSKRSKDAGRGVRLRIPGRRGSRRDGGVIFSSSGQVKVKREKRGRETRVEKEGWKSLSSVEIADQGRSTSLYDSFGIRKGRGMEFSRKSDQR